MGNCLSPSNEKTKNCMPKRTSSLINLEDSRHVMIKRSSRNGTIMQEDGSFYRPRGESFIVDYAQTQISENNRPESTGSGSITSPPGGSSDDL